MGLKEKRKKEALYYYPTAKLRSKSQISDDSFTGVTFVSENESLLLGS